MTPAEHRAEAEQLATEAERFAMETAELLALAQVHATLALAPQRPAQPPQQRVDLSKEHLFPDALGDVLTVGPTAGNAGVIGTYAGAAWLIEDPDVLRTLASLLTAHADRLEPKP